MDTVICVLYFTVLSTVSWSFFSTHLKFRVWRLNSIRKMFQYFSVMVTFWKPYFSVLLRDTVIHPCQLPESMLYCPRLALWKSTYWAIDCIWVRCCSWKCSTLFHCLGDHLVWTMSKHSCLLMILTFELELLAFFSFMCLQLSDSLNAWFQVSSVHHLLVTCSCGHRQRLGCFYPMWCPCWA